ncbi:hypothetical protein ACLOJK_040486 [Asimina triloba]
MSLTSIIFRRSSHRLSLSLPPFSFRISKCFSSSSSSSSSSPSLPPIQTDLSHPIYMIWASNTGLGKTLVSAGLASSILLSPSSPNRTKFNYIKPVQTGFPQDSDSRFVFRKVSKLFLHREPSAGLLSSNHFLWASAPAADELPGGGNGGEGLGDLCWYEEKRVGAGEEAKVVQLICKTIYGWKEAISPHLAAEKEGGVVEDAVLRESLQRFVGHHEDGRDCRSGEHVWTVVETAGGVASPGPSGTLQCDLYRLPAILVGDGRLGGISGTISAYESLKLRGYDVAAVVLEDHGLLNESALSSYLRNRVPVLVLPCIPQDPQDDLIHWFDDSHEVFCSLQDIMLKAYSERLKRLHEMPKKAIDVLWWPFTQHNHVPEEIVTVIDSRSGENFAVHKDMELKGIELARDMGYATARFGHVMFPENVYEPALRCAELLLDGVGRG